MLRGKVVDAYVKSPILNNDVKFDLAMRMAYNS